MGIDTFSYQDLPRNVDLAAGLPSRRGRSERLFFNIKRLQPEIPPDLASRKHRAIEEDLEQVQYWINS